MKEHRKFQYILNETDRELVDKETNGIQYIKRRSFQKAVDDGLEYSLVGRTRLRRPGQNKEDKYDLLQTGRRKYILDKYKYRRVKGYIPVGGNRYVEYVGIWLLILWFILFGLLALSVCLLLFRGCGQEEAVIKPGASTIVTASDTDTEPEDEEISALLAVVTLPEGDVTFEGTVPEPSEEPEASSAPDSTSQPQSTSAPAENPTAQPQTTATPAPTPAQYTGQAHLKVTLDVDGEPHTLMDYDTDIQNGEIPDAMLDFTILDFELLPGTYERTAYITYPSGQTVEKPITVVVRQSNSGSMAIGFSQEVYVELSSGAISCNYAPDSGDTHDTTVQLVLVSEEEEYVLAQSETIHPGEILTGMTLDDSMTGRLQTGVYDGYLRLTFDSDMDENVMIPVTTDIEVSILVQ